MPGKRLNSQAQQLVIKLIQYFEREKENGGPLQSLNSVKSRVSEALEISERTIYTIQQRHRKNGVLSSPGKKRPRRNYKSTDLPETSKMGIRDCLYNMYKEKKHVTLKTIHSELKERDVMETVCSKSSLQIVLKDIGFKFKKEDNRRASTEKVHISSMRACFLRKYTENINSSERQVVFLDETWIYAKGSKRKSWQDDDVRSVRKPEGYDGKRFIVLHAATREGFIENASLLFHSKSNTLDYHGEMINEIFINWTKDKLIPNLQEPSLIIMDNAPYHSMLLEKQPCTSWKKEDISNWLKSNNIHYEDKMTKVELLAIAKMNRKEKVYVIDELLRENGHEVLRLPPYHCEFNAIELIWARAKDYYNKNIGRDGYGDDKVLSMWEEALATTNVTWENCVKHTEKIGTNVNAL